MVEVRSRKSDFRLGAREPGNVATAGGDAEANGETKGQRGANSHDREESGYKRAEREGANARHEWRERMIHGVDVAKPLRHEGASA